MWRFCRRRWERAGFAVVEGASEKGLFAARNQASRNAGDWTVAVFADADYALARPDIAAAACKYVEQDEYVCLFDELRVLGPEATEQFITTGSPGWHEEAVSGVWLGCFAIGRALFDEVGGFDERFAGRAGQDVAFLHAAGTLGRQRRIPGAAYHLWHPPAEGRVKDETLMPHYYAATGNPERMRTLLHCGDEWATAGGTSDT